MTATSELTHTVTSAGPAHGMTFTARHRPPPPATARTPRPLRTHPW